MSYGELTKYLGLTTMEAKGDLIQMFTVKEGVEDNDCRHF